MITTRRARGEALRVAATNYADGDNPGMSVQAGKSSVLSRARHSCCLAPRKQEDFLSWEDLRGLIAGYVVLAVILVGFGLLVMVSG
jgi:hypothetical protein